MQQVWGRLEQRRSMIVDFVDQHTFLAGFNYTELDKEMSTLTQKDGGLLKNRPFAGTGGNGSRATFTSSLPPHKYALLLSGVYPMLSGVLYFTRVTPEKQNSIPYPPPGTILPKPASRHA